MNALVLITGGAGFIGSHLADRLLAEGYRVRVLDSLIPQVHGPGEQRPAHLSDSVELHVGDIKDPRAVARALEGVDHVFHFAALDGVGQSMYRAAEYVDVVPTPETTAPELESVYALTKFEFEDGRQRRDFVSVFDVAKARVAALEGPNAAFATLNIGSGEARTVLDVATALARALGQRILPEVTGTYRVGDARQCFADISREQELLDYAPTVDLASGIEQLARFLRCRASRGNFARDRVALAWQGLDTRGLAL
jgi:nucleoside-diphosphate-sugar epimerase